MRKMGPRYLWSGRRPEDDIKKQSDYVIIRKIFEKVDLLHGTYPSGDYESDHIPLVCYPKDKQNAEKCKTKDKRPKQNLR